MTCRASASGSIAVGNPFGLGDTVTAGIVSARGRDIGAGPYDDFIQIDAPVNRGNSGGPTFNLKGEVIGINTAIFSPGGGGNVGIAFAIPASTATPVIEDLKDNGKVSRGWLGVQIQPVTEDIAASIGLDSAKGAIVADTLDSGPAGDAGLKSGDVILSVNGTAIDNARTLVHTIGEMKPDQSAKLEIYRDGEVKDVTVKLGQQPAGDQQVASNDQQDQQQGQTDTGELGLALAESQDGVTVVDVAPGSEGDDKGIQRGDVILQAGGKDVTVAARRGRRGAGGQGQGARGRPAAGPQRRQRPLRGPLAERVRGTPWTGTSRIVRPLLLVPERQAGPTGLPFPRSMG